MQMTTRIFSDKISPLTVQIWLKVRPNFQKSILHKDDYFINTNEIELAQKICESAKVDFFTTNILSKRQKPSFPILCR
jgi:hypothetical protein